MLPYADLARIAQSVARADEDLYQQIWVRFLRFPPREKIGAWQLARWTRDTVWRDERKHRAASLVRRGLEEDWEFDIPAAVFAADDYIDIKAACLGDPEKVGWLLWYSVASDYRKRKDGKQPGSLRVRAHRLRAYLRGKYRR